MPGDISKAIKELASSLKDIEVNKSYREDKIPWKRLLAAAGVSMLIVMIIVAGPCVSVSGLAGLSSP